MNTTFAIVLFLSVTVGIWYHWKTIILARLAVIADNRPVAVDPVQFRGYRVHFWLTVVTDALVLALTAAVLVRSL